MISAADFKKQISKSLSGHLRSLGFKGSGFNYIMDSDEFVYTIGIQASQWGGQCCAEFGIQPKEIDRIGEHLIDFKKIKYYQCELRTRLASQNGSDQWWQYSDDHKNNIKIADEIFELVRKQVVPIINRFKSKPFVLDQIEVSDLNNVFKNVSQKLQGMTLMTTDIRLAWTLTKIYEKRNSKKAIQFAKYGLSKLDNKNLFFGRSDFESVLEENNGV
jgi:hypothetical protein